MKTPDWIATCPSPAYVLEEAKLRANLEVLRRVQAEAGCKIILALKGFSMWSAFPMVRQYLPGCTASSLYELKLSAEEFKGENHIYSAAFREDEFDEICSMAEHIVFNSVAQWQQFGAKALAAGISCGIRVNPGIAEVETDLYNPCFSGSRLGVRPEHLAGTDLSGMEGLHAHALCENLAASSVRLIDAFEKKFADHIPKLKWVNFGGGHLMTHKDYDVDLLIRRISDFREKWGVEVYLEPGGAVAWRTGELVTSVLDIVPTDGLPVAILDISATAHMPDVLEQPYRPIITGSGQPTEKAFTYRLGGTSCLAGDVIGDYSFNKELRPGSRLVFEDMIHYTMVKTTMFNGVRHPDIAILRESGEIEVVRRFTYEDFRNRLS
ncbi:MAG: carboxynorspermidine decarboxylase [Zetaproteobacteria bacterium CG12_big_fil_rev_8_21_14_0_65_55_1124]|nr:MAG: carboxynorspermidine decarboxylase [Zetaproteobacteria bacterium CG1_02_55_237]PIS20484.1 MAG: carboxynorspermidine decarboxylase [Zetaproteobacteria bacterium CG08_land_8_20_14_0_20_55_17]PIW43763.1 MAG: carboxynorspermidine decarboxylase [Zetaproteobacteria bacterium CG12_big_fil_rev_8_21_14_0_65_55_1124]PIY53298.1 MAG: carboxynorspermidine decarboxylase [Zetaproteobacteria bacterium CG_4_10_14_0_8_um_filter_55_43]PIZ40129.1 MAG: carboxynorspermidine decarboxylase [Zetaproteobacteria 